MLRALRCTRSVAQHNLLVIATRSRPNHHQTAQGVRAMSSASLSATSVRVAEWGGPEVLKTEGVTLPAAGPGQVLVKVHAAGVNPVDTYIRSGAYAVKPELPYTPGKEGAGEVVQVGAGVSNVALGARVWFPNSVSGAYATHAVIDSADARALPDGLSFDQGAAIGVAYLTAYRALFCTARAKKGEWVLVHGASGGVGLAAVQLASAAGMRVVGTASSDAGRSAVAAAGATLVFAHRTEGYMDEAVAATGGNGGFDAVIEMLANVNLPKVLPAMAKRGRVAIVGNRGEVTFNPRLLMGKEISVAGTMLYGATAAEAAEAMAAVEAGLLDGSLRPVVGKTYGLGAAQEAHRDVIEHSGGACGKIVLRPQEAA